MYINSGYLNNSKEPFLDNSQPLIISSCGTYRLKSLDNFSTWRPNGRLDYQLLYVASGKTHFYFDGIEQIVSAGHMVLLLPGQEQHYEYFRSEDPHVYWVHFTGSDVPHILDKYDIPKAEPYFLCGEQGAYEKLFTEMIKELQTCRTGYRDLLAMYMQQILLLIQRTRLEQQVITSTCIQKEIESACKYFAEHYNHPINIEEYAQSCGISVSWFQRNFKQITSQTPLQYLITCRINNAASLLQTTDYNVTEISAIVGYDNPLYFSRLFHKLKGMSPSAYKKLVTQNR
jgi:AraC-like DNA-binding protein